MDNNQGSMGCALGCWLVAALGGLLAMVLLIFIGGWTFMQAAFIGAVIFIVAGLLLSLVMCKPLPAPGAQSEVDTPLARAQAQNAADTVASAPTTASQSAAAATAPAAPTSATDATTSDADASTDTPTSGAAASPAPVAAAATASTAAVIKPSAELKGTKELAERKGTYKYEKPVEDAPKAKAPTKKAAAKKPAAKKADAKPAETKAAATKQAPAKKAPAKKAATAEKAPTKKSAAEKPASAAKPAAAKRAPVAADGKPETLTAARGGAADDLKQIKGVGPGLEKTLNELGFYHFDQVAGWRKKEIEWVDSRLKFKGRIERDEWTKQAKVLAKGGTTDFSNKVKKGGVY
ncbi:endonuclease [Ascidiaceihabitans sp.]|uniref:endonuclease n=1 Tax=Ascidiaceihabitans sp. TaxID=1872644 RepID=UPI00329757B5